MRCAIYARYSSDNQRDDSIEDQVRLCRVHIEQAGWAYLKRIAAHMFRECVATSIAIHNPDKVRIAQQLLGHASFATTEAYYILAQTLEAADRYQETLLAYVSPEDMNQCAP